MSNIANNAVAGTGSSIWASVGIWLLILLIAAVGVFVRCVDGWGLKGRPHQSRQPRLRQSSPK
jgi:hypothetical protein